ncbi:hypothetical protein [Brevibacillus antibioticus]|uniref:hypothetical protein n=1 Tax=Brevibacillus antibioticus TaxID=2570228 RepID=UPI001FCC1B3C|nr:hypothetical protein [Brevibacillus antibioticus]
MVEKNLKKASVRLAALGLATALSLSGALAVSANEYPTQKNVTKNQNSEELYAGTYKKVSASETLGDKAVKAAIDQVLLSFQKQNLMRSVLMKMWFQKVSMISMLLDLKKIQRTFFTLQ